MDLNQNQRTAILKALTANEYLLLKGLPGTGKTQTLTALIRLLVLMNKSVLITCHTHSAVDNLLLRLRKSDDQIRFMRLGASKRIHRELKDCSEEFYTSKCETSDELSNIYKEFVSYLNFRTVFFYVLMRHICRECVNGKSIESGG